jgi:hypothetical protein
MGIPRPFSNHKEEKGGCDSTYDMEFRDNRSNQRSLKQIQRDMIYGHSDKGNQLQKKRTQTKKAIAIKPFYG